MTTKQRVEKFKATVSMQKPPLDPEGQKQVPDVIEQVTAALNTRDPANVLELLDEAHVWDRLGHEPLHGREDAQSLLRIYWRAIPNLTFKVVRFRITSPDSAIVKWKATGTPADRPHRSVLIKGDFLLTLKDGRIASTKVGYITKSMTEQLLFDSAADIAEDQSRTLQDQEADSSGPLRPGDDSDSNLGPNGHLPEVTIIMEEIKSKEDLWRELQDIAEKSAEDRTDRDNKAYDEKALQLLNLAITNPNGYTKQAKEVLAHFIDLVGITPKLITVAQAGEFGVSRSKLDGWIRAGVLVIRGRQKAPGRGGGKILVAEYDVMRLAREAPGRGRSWSQVRKT